MLSIPDDLSIPAFLKIDAATRASSWIGRKLTSPRLGVSDEAWREREAQRRAAIEAERKARAAVALARMKEEHAGERWVPKKGWVRDAKSLADLERQQLEEFERAGGME